MVPGIGGLGAACCGTRCTVHLRPVYLRRHICAEGDCCGPGQRMVSAPELLGFALVRSSPTLGFRSHDGATLADGDESAMNPGQKDYSPKWPKNPRVSWAVSVSSARPIAPISAERVRASALRSSPLTFENACSIGLRSGE